MTALWQKTQAQDYRYEIGGMLGTTGYFGDASNSNFFRKPGLTLGAIFRYNPNSRMAIKGNLNYATIAGNTTNNATVLPNAAQYSFNSNLVDVAATFEFNFLNYGIGPKYKRYHRISPYITAGIGLVTAFAQGETTLSPIIPIGLGVKYKLRERLNLGFELTFRKEFSDKIDRLTNLEGIPHGTAKNTDWYAFAGFTITYEFGKRCVKCHYVE